MPPVTDRTFEPTAPPPQDWDPISALTQLAGGDGEGFTERLHRAAEIYARAPEGHLSFDEMESVIAGDSVQLQRHAGAPRRL